MDYIPLEFISHGTIQDTDGSYHGKSYTVHTYTFRLRPDLYNTWLDVHQRHDLYDDDEFAIRHPRMTKEFYRQCQTSKQDALTARIAELLGVSYSKSSFIVNQIHDEFFGAVKIVLNQ